MYILLALSLIFSTNLLALTGKLEMKVQPTVKSDFRGLFWSDVDETVGSGSSPVLTESDLLSAIKEEFTSSQKALEQLEILKGPGGKVFMEFGYFPYSETRPMLSGHFIYRCGVADGKSGEVHGYADLGNEQVTNSSNGIPRYSSEGKFYQFKWASKHQIKRAIAKCFARLPGMPKLKDKNPKETPQLYVDESAYGDFYSWFSSIPGLSLIDQKDEKFRNSVKCLLSNAVIRNNDRIGNVVVIQKAKVKEDSQLHRMTHIREIKNIVHLPEIEKVKSKDYNVFSMAFMDSHSVKNLITNWKNNEIHSQGIWPNYLGTSPVSLLGQVYGDQLHVNMKACFMSSGLKMQDPNKMLPTIYDPFKCQEVDLASLSPQEQLEFRCENGKGDACIVVASSYQQGKSHTCLSKEMGGQCHLVDSKKNADKAKEYFNKACKLGVAEGCFALGNSNTGTMGVFELEKEHYEKFREGCRIKNIPACQYWNRDLDYVDEHNLSIFKKLCQNPLRAKKACFSLGLFYHQRGNSEQGRKYLRKSCETVSIKKGYNSCLELAQIYLKENNKDEAIKVLKRDCSSINQLACPKLFELLDEKKKKELLKTVCWGKEKPCF